MKYLLNVVFYIIDLQTLYWLNDGGSHHFGAARYQARRLGIAVPLTGRLCRYGVNVPMISAIRQQWHLFAIPADELFGSFFDAMNAFECRLVIPVCRVTCMIRISQALISNWSGLNVAIPEPVLLLMYFQPQAFPDFGKQLQQLAKEPLPR
jgi:hypothetical protein